MIALHESIIDSIGNTISTSFQEHTILWIVISGIIGGIITQVLKFVFESTIPEWQRRKATKHIFLEKQIVPAIYSRFTMGSCIIDIPVLSG